MLENNGIGNDDQPEEGEVEDGGNDEEEETIETLYDMDHYDSDEENGTL